MIRFGLHERLARRAKSLVTVCVLLVSTLCAGAAGAWAQDAGEGGGSGGPAGAVSVRSDLLAPIEGNLSGQPWLLATGIDPALSQAPERNPQTGLEPKSLGSGYFSQSPSTQAAGGGFLVPFRNPAPAFSRDILISRDYSALGVQTEPSIAVDPKDPEHIVVDMIDYNFPSISSYVTIDGGATWDGPHQVGYMPDDLISGGDPSMSFDRSGNLYTTSISIGEEDFSIGPEFTSSEVSSIAVSRSTDGGYSWPTIVSVDRSGVKITDQQIDPQGHLRGTVAIGFLDKPWLTVGKNPKDPSKDIIYCTYVEFITYYDILYSGELPVLLPKELGSTIKMARSEDNGVTWSDPVAVAPTVRRSFQEVSNPSGAEGQFTHERTVQGPRPVVDSTGKVYVAWIDSTDDGSMKGLGEIHIASSTDKGVTFSSQVTAVVFNELPFRPRNAFFRYWGSSFPRIAIGKNDDVYIVYNARPPEKPHDDGDIYFIKSTDGAKTWSQPLRLNGDSGSALQFFPEIAVSPSGTIDVSWGDMRDDTTQTRYNMYFTQSTDGGKTWGFEIKDLGLRTKDTRVTDFASNPNRAFPNGLFLGDYFGLAATDNEAYMVWADSRLAEFGGYNQKIAFARQKAMQAPGVYISPASGPGGQSITVQGFNFQPDMNIQVQLQDTTIALSRTNQDGRFTSTIFVPVTGEGAQSLRVFDESGNVAQTSYYTEFGFGNIKQQYDDLSKKIQDLTKTLQSKQLVP